MLQKTYDHRKNFYTAYHQIDITDKIEFCNSSERMLDMINQNFYLIQTIKFQRNNLS